LNARQTSPGRIRRLFVGALLGALLVSGFAVYNMAKGNTWSVGDVGKRQGAGFAEPARRAFPSATERRVNRDDHNVLFVVVQNGATTALHITTDGRWSKLYRDVHAGTLLELHATPRWEHNLGQVKLACAILIDGVLYEDHIRGRFKPWSTGNTCFASALVP
jgi:hypothetical protein